MHAIAVDRAGPRIGQVAVPDLVGVFGQLDALDLALACGVEQADLDFGGVGREQREIDALAVPGGAERIGQTFKESRAAERRCLGGGIIQGGSRDKMLSENVRARHWLRWRVHIRADVEATTCRKAKRRELSFIAPR